MKPIALPASVFEEQLPSLLGHLSQAEAEHEILLDFEAVRFWTPGGWVALLAQMQSWLDSGKQVALANHRTCPAFRYMQRIDFFAHTGIPLAEDFRRHDAGGRFVELRRIGGPDAPSVEELSTDIAYCLFPDADVDDPEQSGLFDLLQYSVSELANNVAQHAGKPGFAMAQYNGQTDLIRVAIADSGIGIRQSFAATGSPHLRPAMTDAEILMLALQPKVSSKSHLTTPWGASINAGVGLTLLKEFCMETGGRFLIASGGASLSLAAGSPPTVGELRAPCAGTVCALAFTRSRIRNFFELLNGAKRAAGLLPAAGNLGKFFA